MFEGGQVKHDKTATLRKSSRLRNISGSSTLSEDYSLAIDIAIDQDFVSSATELNALRKHSKKGKQKKVCDREATPAKPTRHLKQTSLNFSSSPLRRSHTVHDLSFGSNESYVTAHSVHSHVKGVNLEMQNSNGSYLSEAMTRGKSKTESAMDQNAEQPAWVQNLFTKFDQLSTTLKEDVRAA